MSNSPAAQSLSDIVKRIQSGDASAEADLYQAFRDSSAWRILANLGPDEFEDVLHDSFIALLKSVRNGTISSESSILQYSHGVTRNKTAHAIKLRVHRRMGSSIETWFKYDGSPIPLAFHSADRPDVDMEFSEKVSVVAEEFAKLKTKEQEILRRFYFDGEDWPSICLVMRLTPTTFRCNKHRAKQKLGKAVALRMQQTMPRSN